MNNKFLRLNELASLHSGNVESCFHESRNKERESPDIERELLLIEKELCELNIESWNFLKDEANPLCISINQKRYWSPLIEKLNEAKGYCFIKSMGYLNISFIPREKKKGVETPDLKGWRDTSQVLCEVKTINKSDDLIDKTESMTPFTSQFTLTSGLINKLQKTFCKASSQLNSYLEYSNPEKYIYLIIEYDEIFFVNEFHIQVRELFDAMKLPGVDLVIHNGR